MLELKDFEFREDNAQATLDRGGNTFYFWPARHEGNLVRVYISRVAMEDELGLRPKDSPRQCLLQYRERIQKAANENWRLGEKDVYLEFERSSNSLAALEAASVNFVEENWDS